MCFSTFTCLDQKSFCIKDGPLAEADLDLEYTSRIAKIEHILLKPKNPVFLRDDKPDFLGFSKILDQG